MVLPDLISPEQTGFMSERSICENLRRTLETVKFTKRNNKQGLIISIDFMKCFDLVSHQSIAGAFKFFGFSPKFIDMVIIFYNDFQLYMQNYGFISESFRKGRGVNQGCPISPLNYLCPWRANKH